jgi:uncharacterized protein (TIGR02391 family)
MAKKPPEKRDAILSFTEMEAAVRKIDRRIADLEAFDVDAVEAPSDAKIEALRTALYGLLVDVFGSHTNQFDRHSYITLLDSVPMAIGYTVPIHEVKQAVAEDIAEAKAVLETIKRGFVEQLEDAGHTATGKPLRAYEGLDLHPEINRQVGQLYRDGHYAEAVEKSVKVLNDLVRLRSGLALDGTALMEKACSPGNPVLRFNDLSDDSDKNEQKGFMFLFSGAVTGLRNPRAHRLMQDDPERALEFIAFVSLLAKLLGVSRGRATTSHLP